MTIRRISVDVEVDIQFDIDERHIDMMMSDEWQKPYYRFEDREQALEYVARCMALFGRLDGLDGHANLPEDWAPTQLVSREVSGIDVWDDSQTVTPKEPT